MNRTLFSLAVTLAMCVVLSGTSASAALSGKIVYVDAGTGDLRVRYLGTGQDLPIPYRPGVTKRHARLSPLGDDRVVVTVSGRKFSGIRVFQFTWSGNDISVNLVGTEKTITTSGWANWPTYSVNGEWIAYGDGSGKNNKGLWVRRADGSGVPKLLLPTGDSFPFAVWDRNALTSDGKLTSTRLAFVVPTPTGSEKDIWTMNVSVDGSGNINGSNVAPLLQLAGLDLDLDWQPSGRIAFNFHMGQVLGQQIHTVDPATVDSADPYDTGLKQLIGGIEPRWSPDASMIAFRSGGAIWIMDANGTLIDGNPTTTPIDPFIIGSGHATWGQ